MDEDALKQTYARDFAMGRDQLQSLSRKLQFLEPSALSPYLVSSRLGGPVAWPAGVPIPTDGTGAPMVFVAQINFSGTHDLPDFPREGLLQLFLANDVSERGITFSREHRRDGDYPLQNGAGFKLVFHRETEWLVETRYQLPQADYPIYHPEIQDEPKTITLGQAADQFPPMTHWQGSTIYERFEQLPEAEDHLEELHELLCTDVWDAPLSTEFYLGGYASPLQLDQRRFFDEYRKYDTCVMNFGALPLLDLPDMNLAVLISRADLLAMRFDDTVLIADTD